MSKIYVFNALLTSEETTNYILSTDKYKICFPFFEITSPRYLYNETRINIKNLFKSDTIKFIEEIIVSFVDIQNEFLIEYISNLESIKVDIEQDIFLLCSTILTSRLDSELFWNKFNYEISLDKPDIQASIIDHCVQRTIS